MAARYGRRPAGMKKRPLPPILDKQRSFYTFFGSAIEFTLQVAAHQQADGLVRIGVFVEDVVHGLADGQLHAVLLSQLHQRLDGV